MHTFSFIFFCISSPQSQSINGSFVLKELYTADNDVIHTEVAVAEMKSFLSSNVVIISTVGYWNVTLKTSKNLNTGSNPFKCLETPVSMGNTEWFTIALQKQASKERTLYSFSCKNTPPRNTGSHFSLWQWSAANTVWRVAALPQPASQHNLAQSAGFSPAQLSELCHNDLQQGGEKKEGGCTLRNIYYETEPVWFLHVYPISVHLSTLDIPAIPRWK